MTSTAPVLCKCGRVIQKDWPTNLTITTKECGACWYGKTSQLINKLTRCATCKRPLSKCECL